MEVFRITRIIVQIEDKNHIFQFKLVGIENINEEIITPINDSVEYTEYTPKEYDRIKRKPIKEAPSFNYQSTY